MKYLVKVPILAYGEFFLSVDEDLDIEDIKFKIAEGELELDVIEENPIKEFTLIGSVDNFEVPDHWPFDIQLNPISDLN